MKHQKMNLHDVQKTYSGSEVQNNNILSHILPAAQVTMTLGLASLVNTVSKNRAEFIFATAL